MKYHLLIGTAMAVLTLAACSGNETPSETHTTETVDVTTPEAAKSNIDAVIASMTHADRPMEARKDDELRKAKEVATFTGISKGDHVLELEAGNGYYTEIFSRIVGADGKVVLQNPAGFDDFLGEEIFTKLLGEDGSRLPNVVRSKTDFDALDAEDNSMDVVTWFLGPHELWFYGPKGDTSFGDPDKTYAEIMRVLKPGGHFIALDHVAASGSPETTGGTTHRIDPAKVRERAEAIGLVFIKESDVLANPDDNYDTMVFDPSVRRKTDRFLHMYKKP